MNYAWATYPQEKHLWFWLSWSDQNVTWRYGLMFVLSLIFILLYSIILPIPLKRMQLSDGWKGLVVDTCGLLGLYSHSLSWSWWLQWVRCYLWAFKKRESKQRWRWKPSVTSETERSCNHVTSLGSKKKEKRGERVREGIRRRMELEKTGRGKRVWVKEAGEWSEGLLDEMKCHCWKTKCP